MASELDVMLAMQDDAFKVILENDELINDLEKEKYNASLEFNELMNVLSKIFKVNGVICQTITPAIWAYLYCIGNAYAVPGKKIENIDTDIFLYLLNNSLQAADGDIVLKAAGFCQQNGIDYIQTQADLKSLVYLSFRPLEMLDGMGGGSLSPDEIRFNADWITKTVSIVAPMTNRTSLDIIFNMSLTECFYYYIQSARKTDDKGLIKRKNSDEIEAQIFKRTLELGKEYYKQNYEGK